jgi:hypothetical protein
MLSLKLSQILPFFDSVYNFFYFYNNVQIHLTNNVKQYAGEMYIYDLL